MAGLYLQYGCGISCPEDWINYDVSPRLRIEKLPVIGSLLRKKGHAIFPVNVKYGDIISGLPHAEKSVSAIYCSHVLEHLDRTSVEKALRNTLNLLEPGGVFRLVVPDLEWRAKVYVNSAKRAEDSAADTFMTGAHLGVQHARNTTVSRLRMMFGNSAHLWMYDLGLMTKLLKQAGFVEIRRCVFGDAEDQMFEKVEEHGRFVDAGHDELAIEAKRPNNG
jgi:SAM-dependent methyltransferase